MFKQDKLIKHSEYGWIFEQDVDWFKQYADGRCTIDTSNDSINNLHMDFFPEQVVGNPTKAKVFLLNMNPSFDPSNHQNQVVQQQEIRDTINGMYDVEYPFYCLNPKYDSTDGNKWWRNGHHFKSWEVAGYSRSDLAKTFCCIELFPYHCKRLPARIKNDMSTCPSTMRMVNFLHDELIPKAKVNEAIIILLRCSREWGVDPDPVNNIFKTSNIQTANFSTNNQFQNVIKSFLP